MTQAEELDKLIEAVEVGEANFDWGFASSPSRKALPTEWHDAMNAYLGSLDAAKALHEALLPGWMWIVRATNEADFGSGRCAESCNGFANVWGGVCPNEGGEHFDVFAETPARAFLLAVLKAYRAGL